MTYKRHIFDLHKNLVNMVKVFNYSVFLTFVCFTFTFVGCSDDVPGCTDPQSINFDDMATEDDGSCTYARDIFLSRYLGTFTCQNPAIAGFINSDSLNFEIKEPVDDSDRNVAILSLSIDGFPVDLAGMVEGDTFTLRDTLRDVVISNLNLTADAVIGVGSAVILPDETLSGTINLTIQSILPDISDDCIIVGMKI